MFRTAVLLSMFLLLALLPVATAQSVTGQITGNLTDQAGAVIIGATVQLSNDLSKQVRQFTTDASGAFVFTGLVPGGYSLRIAHAGFKTYEQRNIVVSTLERVDLHDIRLQVGDVSTSVEVSGQAVHVGTDSSERTSGVNLIQINDAPIRGRDFLATIKALPGIQDVGTHDNRGWGQAMPKHQRRPDGTDPAHSRRHRQSGFRQSQSRLYGAER